ncbi:annexin A4-like [Ornithodoros turicata]|uniref:annexin A4-like n=1 Tax=Ornithodoros turicata TaxID=34597 RepID=UPI003139EEB7
MSYPYPSGGSPYPNQQGGPGYGGYPIGPVYGSSGPGYPPANPSPGYPLPSGQESSMPGSGPGYPINPAQSFPTAAYPGAVQPNQNYPTMYPPAQGTGDGFSSMPTSGFPAQQGYPGFGSGCPMPQTGGYPASQGPGYPPSQGTGYPPSQGTGYPPSQGTGYPPSQGTGYAPSQVAGYPTQAPAYPTSQASGYAPQAHPHGQIYQSAGNVTSASRGSAYPTSGAPTMIGKYASPIAASSGSPRHMASIKPYAGFNANDDAQALRKAMKGFGTDEAAIIAILCARSSDQRQQIMVAYKQMHGRDLIKDLKSELSGKFEDVIIGLMTPMYEYLASEVRHAISGIGTNEDTLIEVLCTRSNAEINQIKYQYKQKYGKDLEKDIIGDTSGYLRRILVSVCNAARPEGQPVDPARAADDAQKLYAAGVGQWGTDESTFRTILCSQSFEQLRQVFREYARLTDHDIMEAIKKEMSGEIKQALLTIVKAVYNTQLYFAEKLHDAMKGAGTEDRVLIRLVVSRSEVDLAMIRQEYYRAYGKSLEEAIKGDTSGDYRKALIALVSGN